MTTRKRFLLATNLEPATPNISSTPATGPRWIYNSQLDLMVGCGAWSAPLLCLAYLLGSRYPQGIAVVFYALALVFNYPHYMATIYRAYRTREDFVKYKLFTLHLTLLIGLLLIVAHVSNHWLAIIFTLYLTWSPFHYSGQNFGIALMFARRNGVHTTRELRWTFYTAFLSSYAMFFLAVHSFQSNDQLILTLGIPLKVARLSWSLMLVAFVVASFTSLSAFIKETGWRSMTAPILLLFTQLAWFVIPTALTLFSNIDFLQARSTAAILAVMHSAQYLWITSYYARRESNSDDAAMARPWRPYLYFAVLVVGGISLFVPGPWITSRLMHVDFTTSFLAFTALVNIHHFLLDGAIWKLRDGRISALLLNAKTNPPENTTAKVNACVAWLISPRQSARAFRVAAALTLILLAGLDQLKFYYGAKASDISSLRRAQLLNPYDASLQLKLAKAAERDGNKANSQSALEQAIHVNPDLIQAQTALAKLLIESGKYDEAYAHYQKMFAHVSPDADSLVNFGLLSARLGKTDDAIDAWERAITLDDSQANAHLNLADALVLKKRFAEAIPHYEHYLALVSPASNLEINASAPQPESVLSVVLRLAFACQQTQADDTAVRFFIQAATMAETLGNKDALSYAFIHSAEIKAKYGKPHEALIDFQRGLKLQESSSAGAQAADWLAYGEFLRDAKVSSRLVFACFSKAEALMQNKSSIVNTDEALSRSIARDLETTKASIAANDINAVKTDLESVLREALTVNLPA